MPSLKQINSDSFSIQKKEEKKSKINSILKYFLFIILVTGWYVYRDRPKIIKISDKTWETRSNGVFKELFDNNIKKIIWFGAPNCPVVAQKKQYVENSIKYHGLEKYYIQKPYLQGTMLVKCEDKECMDISILNECSNSYCIVVPNIKTIIKVDKKNLFQVAEQYKLY